MKHQHNGDWFAGLVASVVMSILVTIILLQMRQGHWNTDRLDCYIEQRGVYDSHDNCVTPTPVLGGTE